MPRTTNVLTMRAKLTRERRTNRRLRALIENLREDIRGLHGICAVNVKRLGQLQAQVDRLMPPLKS